MISRFTSITPSSAMKKLALLLIAAPLFCQANDTRQLLAGSWKYTLANGCTETITHRPDGTLRIVSGEEISDATYSLKPIDVKKESVLSPFYTAAGHVTFEPGVPKTPVDTRYGAYLATFHITKDYGGTDCLGSAEDATDGKWTIYLFFNKNKTEFTSCSAFEQLPCLGPFKKQPE